MDLFNVLTFSSYSRLPMLLGFLGSFHWAHRSSFQGKIHILTRDFTPWLTRYFDNFESIKLSTYQSDSLACDKDQILALGRLQGLLNCSRHILLESNRPLLILFDDFLVSGPFVYKQSQQADLVIRLRARQSEEGFFSKFSSVHPGLSLIWCSGTESCVTLVDELLENLRDLKAEPANHVSLHAEAHNEKGALLNWIAEKLTKGGNQEFWEGDPRLNIAPLNESEFPLVALPEFKETGSSSVFNYHNIYGTLGADRTVYGPAYIDTLVMDRWCSEILYPD